MKSKVILLVEDNPDDVQLTLRALKKSKIMNEVVVAQDGVEALDYLFGTGKYAGRDVEDMPQVVLLDLKMPKMDGLEALQAHPEGRADETPARRGAHHVERGPGPGGKLQAWREQLRQKARGFQPVRRSREPARAVLAGIERNSVISIADFGLRNAE